MQRPFRKPATTITEQIALLQAEGMVIQHPPQTEHWLRHVSYYRLSAYWLPFEKSKSQAGPHFRPGTDFAAIVSLYEFDRKLRLQLLVAIERIEVALRGSWAYELAHHAGPHGYLDAALYANRGHFHENLARLVREVGTSPETYIAHYRDNYDDPPMPPVWMVAEMMAFGQLSRWYSGLRDRGLRNKIARPLGLPEAVLVPFVKHLATVRNSCAHHARLWNRGFLIRMQLPQKPADLANTLSTPTNHGPAQLYNTLAMVRYVLMQIDPAATWKDDLRALLTQRSAQNLEAMGFPPDWQQRPLWA